MLVLKIVLICQMWATVRSVNDTGLKRSMNIDADGRVIEVATRIVGGQSVDIKTYPFMVSIQWRLGSRHHCGGTYILPRFVLSAAHCMLRHTGDGWELDDPKFYVVLAGSSNLWYSPTWQISVTDAVLPHPEYDFISMANDIGLFRITKPLRITPYVSYVPLPFGRNSNVFANPSDCNVIGWGKTSEFSTVTSSMLQHVTVPFISLEDCKRFFPHKLHHTHICAGKIEGGVDACQGDSGGPLMCNDTQIGIVSWGHGCAAANSPGVYCRVDAYIDWIGTTTRKNNAFPNKAISIHPWISLAFYFFIVPFAEI